MTTETSNARGEWVLVPREVFDFLMGEGELQGAWFGETPAGERGEWFWRKHLRQAEATTPPPAEAHGDGEGDMEVPFVAISNDELGPPLGDAVTCPTCGSEHPVEYGTSRRMLDDGTWSEPEPSRLLGFYKCGEKLYLAGVAGRQV